MDHSRQLPGALIRLLPDFYRDPTKLLAKLANIPFIRVRDTRNPAKIDVSLCRPNEIFFRPQEDSSTSSNLYSVYQRVFLYVDYGTAANSFLEACGVKRQPSIEQLAGLIVGNPERFLGLAQTKDLWVHPNALPDDNIADDLPCLDIWPSFAFSLRATLPLPRI